MCIILYSSKSYTPILWFRELDDVWMLLCVLQEFLSSLSVVHRDLACRNILVCDNSLVKISDFGLSRTLVNQEAYVTTTKGVLPIRWMAPEALFYRTFDTQSDVWSFGILLWELYTLGKCPAFFVLVIKYNSVI